MWSYDAVLEKFCICDVLMYLKARGGVVLFPERFAGKKVEDVVKGARGVVITTSRGGVDHVFVVKHSAYLRKAAFVSSSAVA